MLGGLGREARAVVGDDDLDLAGRGHAGAEHDLAPGLRRLGHRVDGVAHQVQHHLLQPVLIAENERITAAIFDAALWAFRERELKNENLSFYTIGSSGHEGNAAVARAPQSATIMAQAALILDRATGAVQAQWPAKAHRAWMGGRWLDPRRLYLQGDVLLVACPGGKDYQLKAFDTRTGNKLWETDVPGTGGGNATQVYQGPTLATGGIYQWWVDAMSVGGNTLSRTEDLRGVFQIGP